MIETIHKLSGSMTSREKREAQYGRLFSYAAIVSSTTHEFLFVTVFVLKLFITILLVFISR